MRWHERSPRRCPAELDRYNPGAGVEIRKSIDLLSKDHGQKDPQHHRVRQGVEGSVTAAPWAGLERAAAPQESRSPMDSRPERPRDLLLEEPAERAPLRVDVADQLLHVEPDRHRVIAMSRPGASRRSPAREHLAYSGRRPPRGPRPAAVRRSVDHPARRGEEWRTVTAPCRSVRTRAVLGDRRVVRSSPREFASDRHRRQPLVVDLPTTIELARFPGRPRRVRRWAARIAHPSTSPRQ